NVSPVNDAPATGNDAKPTAEDTAVVIPVLDNDSDIDMDKSLNAHWELESIGVVIPASGVVKPQHGSVSTNGTTITYTPNKDYNGSDTFEYYCSDGDTQTKASVTVTITQVNDSPVANPDTVTISEDSATDYIDVMANDTDVDTGAALNQNDQYLTSKFSVSAAWIDNTSIGIVDLTGNKIKFTPATNWNGTATIHYTLLDGYTASCDSTLTVTVDPVNDVPVFSTAPSNLTLTEDGANGTTDIVVGDVETAVDSLSVTVINSSKPSLIATTDVTVTKGTDGARTITVNPKDNQNGEATITLQVDDLTLGTQTITFLVTLTAVNDTPVADDKTLNIAEDATIQTITKASVTHDVDIETDKDALTLTITKAASHGTAAIDASGNLTYIPNGNFNGTDSFEYTATDKWNATDTGTVTVNVSPVNDAPATGNDAKTTPEDTAVEITVLSNDGDVDMNTTLNLHPELESIGVVIPASGVVKPLHGTVSTDGITITYTPNKDYNGSDTFEYYCSDGDTQTKASVTVTITQVNDDPSAIADSGSTDEDVPVSVNVLENDSDVDTIAALNQNDLHDTADFSIDRCYIYGTAHGTIEKNGASIDYDPDADFYGTQTIQYVLSDGKGGTSIGTLTIEVGSENDAPIAADDEMIASEDHTASVNVLDNDTDVDTGDTKTFVGFTKSTSGLPGTFTTNAKGDITFTPDEDYNGSFTIPYQMKDAGNLTSIATLTVTITPVNDTPTADNANVTTNEDHAKDTDVSTLIGDADILINADELTVTVAAAGEPLHGTVTVSGTTITYTPDANYNGTDEIVYTVTDKAGAHTSAKLSITVNPINDAPVADNDKKTTQEDTAVDILALANDSDVDTDTQLNKTPALAPIIESVTNGAHGKAVTDGTKITYTPDENFNGTDVIQYVLSDGSLSDEATINITITQVNDEIQAVDDTAKTNDEDLVTIEVLANDTDIDTLASLNLNALNSVSDFTLTAVGTPEHGTAKIASGKIDYTPEDRFAGTDRFTYTVSDGHGSSKTAWVTVTVINVNDPPKIIVVSKPQTGDRVGTGSKVTVEWTGFDIDGDVLTYTLDYFDGTSWHPIADNLSGTSYVFSIPDSLASTNGLKFRVNVRDSEFTSDYGYSGIMSVDKDAPTGTIVTMRTADGRAYTAGVWTNQTVTVVANSSVDASKVTYYYAMDDGTSAAAASMDVVSGVHTVNILATDEFGNTTNLGGYLARVDKQQPAEPGISESISGGSVILAFAFHADPGGSGNNKITMPDGTTVNATDQVTFAAAKNGTYNFALTDVAGNRKVFTYTVSKVDTSKPVISLNSGDYSTGTKTQNAIQATLSFADAQSEITARGYQISTSSTASGTYRAYSSALTLSDPGTYYIHAMAKNAFGLETYQTFGPFIIEKAAAPDVSPTPVPETGDVVVTKEDVEEIPGDAVSIRLPGGEWSDTLTLEDVEPGTYLVEVKDKDGNVRTVEVRVTKRDIVARSVRSIADNITPAAIATIGGAAALMLLLLLAIGHNVTVTVTGVLGGVEKNLRTLRRIKGRKKELIVKLQDSHVKDGQYVVVKLAKSLSKDMRGNTVVVTIRGAEVFREMIPEDNKEAFVRTILINH
ncbi:MAG: Ig-like domain-containing protein, partial [Clostridiaceae bacterium]